MTTAVEHVKGITTQAQTVLGLRRTLATTKADRDVLLAKVRAEHPEYFAALDDLQVALQGAESRLRDLTLVAYADDRTNKQPGPGVGIRVVKTLEYDKGLAFNWGKEHGGLGLKLDEPAFAKIAAATPLAVPFATMTEEVTATIAQDLDKVFGPQKEEP